MARHTTEQPTPAQRNAKRHVIGGVADFPAGGSKVVEIEGRSIGVFNVDGKLYALRNVCPHHGAPLCAGVVTGRMVPSAPHEYQYEDKSKVLRCPWHGYEFDLSDGRSLLRPDTMRVRAYRIEIEQEEVVLYT
jgi:3-phenylpropionate/trans-cinnamate dioxygenase ferredoxin subunit